VQIIIPMSGLGERFRRAGYDVPKALIPVDGKPIIAHVIDLFPGETDFLFICNQQHLDEPAYDMAGILARYCPTGRIVGIAPHKTGPVGAVLQAAEYVRRDGPVIVNYCDFTCLWDYADFKAFVAETGCAGAVPAYRGFHPHSLGSTFYAYMRDDRGWMLDIQEKQPFTDDPPAEYASSGTYYFASGALCLDLFREVVARDLNVSGEYYVSLACKVLAEQGGTVAIYELQHFMQWGTPEDFEEYRGWSDAFRRLATGDSRRPSQAGSMLVPMAGQGARFSREGYAAPKPLLPVSGRPMVVQAASDLPMAPATRFVLRRDLTGREQITQALAAAFPGSDVLLLDEPTDGQATTSRLGVEGLDPGAPLTIGACDNAMLYDPAAFETLMADEDVDLIVWIVRGHGDGRRRPEAFGWVDEDAHGAVTGVRVKIAPADPATAAMVVGAFTFRWTVDFVRAYDRLRARDCRVNGELYADSLIEDALALGLRCRLLEIDHYLGWGTPNDLKTFEYWQSCFHKWPGHPYRLQSDRRIPAQALAELEARNAPMGPLRPPADGHD
jgi:NDP-sugar pyrophosphorylase family protein